MEFADDNDSVPPPSFSEATPGSASASLALDLPHDGATQTAHLATRLRHVMGQAAGVERSKESLTAGLAALERLHEEVKGAAVDGVDHVGNWLDLRNMVLVAGAILGSALRRTESRGAHFRTDHLDTCNQDWFGNLSAQLSDGELRYHLEPCE